MRALGLSVVISITTFTVMAADTNTDKSRYDLFHPTPGDLLRPMNSESADKIPNPFTVDAGHVQIEATLLDYYDGNRQGTLRSSAHYDLSEYAFFWRPKIKLGLLNNLDLEVEPRYSAIYISQADNRGFRYAHYSRSENQFGDVEIAAKLNFWGNDGGATALAIRPYILIPTEGGGRTVIGGMQVPFAWQLPWELTFKISTAVYASQRNDGTTYVGFDNWIALEKNLTDQLLIFCNLSTSVTTDSAADWVGYAGFGAAYTVSRNFQAYAGMRFGFENGYDYNPYVGITLRF